MSISRVLARLILIPLGGVLAASAATLVAFFANWNVFLSVIGGDAVTSGDVVAVMVALAMLLVSSAATFPMLLPAVIGVTISEAFAVRSVVFHVLNGVVSIWVGRNSMVDPGRPFEFHDHPPAVLALPWTPRAHDRCLPPYPNPPAFPTPAERDAFAGLKERTRAAWAIGRGCRRGIGGLGRGYLPRHRADGRPMNHTGLLIALAVAVVAGLVFGLYPQLDLALMAPFHDPASGWVVSGRGWVLVRNAASWIIALIAAPAAIALIGKFVRPHKTTLMCARAALMMVLTLALGPGLLANVMLKDHWGRPRPIDVTEFGGSFKFVPWWDPRGGCPKNCSFVAGEPSGAFWTL